MLDPINHLMLFGAIMFAGVLQGIMDGESIKEIVFGSFFVSAIAFTFTEVVIWVLYFSLEVV